MIAAQTLTEPARSVPVFGEFDIVVLGGGLRGGDNAAPHAQLQPAVTLDKRPDEEIAVEPAVGTQVEQASGIGTARGWFEFRDDFERANFGSAGNRSSRPG